MRVGRKIAGLTAALAAVALAAPAAQADTFTTKTLHWDVAVGPNGDQHCDVIGDLYKPDGATKAQPAPAILTTNGFGGSKDDQADTAKLAASRGYVVLSYSGLGFGGSGCKITLDDRDYDGKAGSQLVTFLGGGKAATDGTKVDYVKLDDKAHDGKHHANDPRVGMIGGSYGGQIQFAVAGIDPRVDTIIPIITWNDLSYSLAPNNTSLARGVTYDTPGIEKYEWTSLFFGLGIADGVQGASADPARNVGCPNFDDRACGSKVQMDATGAPNDATIAFSRHASVTSFLDDIKIPTLLAQGQADTLFNLNESVATYEALKARGIPTKLMWESWGHSGGDAEGSGELDFEHPDTTYQTREFMRWFDHYLGGAPEKPSLDFTYFRDWIDYKGDATPAYARAASYPPARTQTLSMFLSGSDALVSDSNAVSAGSASFSTLPAGAPASYTETSALDQDQPVTDTPGTFAQFVGQPLAADLDVVGIPTADVTVSAPTHANSVAATGAPGALVLFFKLYDLKPDGTIVLAHRLIAPVRMIDFTHPVHVQLPGIVHRFAKGDRVALTVSSSDAAYRGNNTAGPITISTDPASPGVLKLPAVPVPDQQPIQDSAQEPARGPVASRCIDRRKFSFHVHQPHNDRVVRVRSYVNGKRAASARGRRITHITLKRLPKGVFTVKIVAVTKRGLKTISVRRYKGCKKSRPHSHRRHPHRHR